MSTTREFIVSGMHCSSCSMLVTINLEDLAGVEQVSCDHATGKTVVTYDETVTGPDEIIANIVASGHEAELAEEGSR